MWLFREAREKPREVRIATPPMEVASQQVTFVNRELEKAKTKNGQ